MSNNRSNAKDSNRKKMWILLHMFFVVCIVALVVALIGSQAKIAQITMMPSPAPVETASGELPLPIAVVTPSPSPAASEKPTPTPAPTPTESAVQTPTPAPSKTAKPTAAPTPKPTAAPTPTATPTAAPTDEPTETVKPTTKPTAKPTAEPTAEPTASPTPDVQFTYSVGTEQGVAPVGYTFVVVTVTPAGDYTVTYDGEEMMPSGNDYLIMTKILEGGGYRSHVSVVKN